MREGEWRVWVRGSRECGYGGVLVESVGEGECRVCVRGSEECV